MEGVGSMSGVQREVPSKVTPKLVKKIEVSSPGSRFQGESDGMNLPMSVPGGPSNAQRQPCYCAKTLRPRGGGLSRRLCLPKCRPSLALSKGIPLSPEEMSLL